MEILAPAGSNEQLIAAVRSGANAVYLGLKNFNARMSAENFDNLKDTVSYCHIRGVKVYVALNTLFTENETESIKEALKEVALSGADALIVADLGVALLAKQCCPSLPLHASTQMTVHDLAGVKVLETLGFKRVILARELTKDEIAFIVKNTSLEVEVFVHGALCMCVSGQCYISSILGQRSGNRGRCAQPCRLNFKTDDREFALSLKDLSLINKIDELKEIGVASLKIEGRMKRPEYVAAAVNACKQALKEGRANTKDLQAVFSRSGFTAGYFENKRNREMFGIRTKEDVVAAKGVLSSIANEYRNEMPLIKVDMKFKAKANNPCELTVTDGKNTALMKGDVPSAAQNKPLGAEYAANALKKLGGTPFFAGEINCEIEDGLFLTNAQLNDLRKAAIEKLSEKRGQTVPHKFKELAPFASAPKPDGKRRIYTYLSSASQYSELLGQSSDMVFMPASQITQEHIEALKGKLGARLPKFLFGNAEHKYIEIMKNLKALGVKSVSIGNIGGIFIAKKLGFEIYGEYTLNVLNRLSLTCLKMLGVKEADISVESSFANTNKLTPVIPTGVLGYGHIPIMSFRNCPAKGERGCMGCNGLSKMTDRMKVEFELKCFDKMYSELLNPNALYVGDRRDEVRGISHFSLLFTTENEESCRRILTTFVNGGEYTGKYTRGLYYKELL